jgi:hypothetical protein
LKDDSSPCFFDNPFNEFHSEARESVSVGNHNCFDFSALDIDQKPLETFPFVVEPGRDIFIESVLWIQVTQRVDLALKIIYLLG